ncbi:MAG: serine/threonine protein kinase, partial [Planctomycetes bacterium]|nr:serine/threonine protein kinase [Planctomycetota bacterium]
MTAPQRGPGQILSNRYRLDRVLGKGGMGQVFLAHDLSTGEAVALKTFRDLDDDADRRRFEREIRTLQSLSHPNIVPLRDVGWAGDTLFYTMEYLPGVTLEEVIAARSALPNEKILDWYLRICLQVCEALAYLHGRHIVHRDVKPANILLRAPHQAPGAPRPAEDWVDLERVKASLTDFGLVKTRAGDGSLTQTAIGTPQYMAPEQIEASPAVDERSDLYSFGVLLHRIATGRLPFQRLSEALSRRPAPPIRAENPDAPEMLQELVRRLLEFEPHRRPANAEEVSGLLGAALERKGEKSVGTPAPSKRPRPFFCGRGAELQTWKRCV